MDTHDTADYLFIATPSLPCTSIPCIYISTENAGMLTEHQDATVTARDLCISHHCNPCTISYHTRTTQQTHTSCPSSTRSRRSSTPARTSTEPLTRPPTRPPLRPLVRARALQLQLHRQPQRLFPPLRFPTSRLMKLLPPPAVPCRNPRGHRCLTRRMCPSSSSLEDLGLVRAFVITGRHTENIRQGYAVREDGSRIRLQAPLW
jgi:hypothetical protein